jgi:amino acid transporter
MTTSIARQRQERHDPIAASLAQNRLGVPPVAFVGLAGAAPLTVIAGGATAGWLVTGVKGIPVAYLAMAAVLAVFAVGYTAMSRDIVNAGAFYSYIAQGLGRIPGVAAAGVALVAYNAMQVGLIGGFGYVGAQTLETVFHVHTSWWLVAFVGWAAVAVMGVARIDLSGRVLAVLLSAEILISLVYAVVQLAHPAGGHVSFATLAPTQLGEKTMGAGFATAIAGFVGFEATAVYASEARDPRRTVPRATYLALGVIGLLYAGCSWAMSVATGPDQIVAQATDKGTELTFSLVAPHLTHAWIDAGHWLFATSLFAAMLAFHNTVARYGFALGREGVLPRLMGTATRAGAPKWGSLTQSVLGLGTIVLYAAAGWDPYVQLFFWLTVLGGVGVLILMTTTSFAVVGFFAGRESSDVSLWARRVAPVLSGLGLLYVLWQTFRAFPVLLGVQPTDPVRWWLLASFAIVAVLGALRAAWMRHRQADRFAGIGYGTHSELAGVA